VLNSFLCNVYTIKMVEVASEKEDFCVKKKVIESAMQTLN